MIDQQLDGVFIHVTSLSQAIKWYSHLLNIPKQAVAHDGMIYDLPISGSTQVILDAYPKPVPPGGTGPRLMLKTDDLATARELALSLSENVTDVQDIGSSLVFYVEDPDGNLICIRQPKQSTDSSSARQHRT